MTRTRYEKEDDENKHDEGGRK